MEHHFKVLKEKEKLELGSNSPIKGEGRLGKRKRKLKTVSRIHSTPFIVGNTSRTQKKEEFLLSAPERDRRWKLESRKKKVIKEGVRPSSRNELCRGGERLSP